MPRAQSHHFPAAAAAATATIHHQSSARPDMLGKRPRPFLRTTSQSLLAPAFSGDDLAPPPPPPPGVKCLSAAPQYVVIGFDVESSKPSIAAQSAAGESPRSVLEPGALCHSSLQYHQSRSPRSVLGSLLSGPESHHIQKQGVGLGVVAAIRAEELAAAMCEKSKPIAITGHSIRGSPACREMHGATRVPYFVNVRDVEHSVHDDDDGEDDEDDLFSGAQESIFCPSSPFLNCRSLDLPAGDFLSMCYFCKRRLKPGKDIFMYRGDRAFCSVECRYQQIAIDEAKERYTAGGGNCSPVALLCDGKPCPVVSVAIA